MKYLPLFLLLFVSCVSARADETNVYTLPAITIISSCPNDMVYIERENHSFCIDRFEYPNKEGQYPISAINAHEAESLCGSINKRICFYDEWYQACVGKENLKYSYGTHYIKGNCNDSKIGWIPPKWKLMGTPGWKLYAKTLYKGDPSGSHPKCKSDEGVFDLLGNVREWTKSPNTQYGYTIPSSYFYGTMDGNLSCTYKITNHSSYFGSYEFSDRCCKDGE